MSHRQVITTCAAIGLCIATAATAATSTKQRLQREAETQCADDATRLCGDVMGDDAKTAQCMKGKHAQLSPACLKASSALTTR